MRYFFHVEDGVCIRDPKAKNLPMMQQPCLRHRTSPENSPSIGYTPINGAWWSRTQTAFASVQFLWCRTPPSPPEAFLFRVSQFISWPVASCSDWRVWCRSLAEGFSGPTAAASDWSLSCVGLSVPL